MQRSASSLLLSRVTSWRVSERNVEIPANEINICSKKRRGWLIIRTYSRGNEVDARARDPPRVQGTNDGINFFFYFPRHDDELSNVRQNIGTK